MRLTWKIISWDIGMWMWRLSGRLVFFYQYLVFLRQVRWWALLIEQFCRSTGGRQYGVFWVTLVHALHASSKVSVFEVSSSTSSWTCDSNERCKLALKTTFSLSAVFSCLCAPPCRNNLATLCLSKFADAASLPLCSSDARSRDGDPSAAWRQPESQNNWSEFVFEYNSTKTGNLS